MGVWIQHCDSPLGGILLAADEIGLTGLWFEGQKYFAAGLPEKLLEGENVAITQAKHWLELYFSGRMPDSFPPLHPSGSIFRRKVWDILLQIPYGRTMTYGEIARRLASENGRMAAQAVGGAVGHNPISILIPCHRVVGADGGLTGYAGGMERKKRLLEMEKACLCAPQM